MMKDERIHDFMTEQQIKWQFNLSRAPWWGGQFKRMVGLVKAALNKTIGSGFLSWPELQEVLLDVEVALNNRPLCYVEDHIHFPLLAPNSLIFPQPSVLPELQPRHIKDYDLRKRARYLQKCKDALWSRWTTEYLHGLRERRRLKHKEGANYPTRGDVVIIKSEEKNQGHWKLKIIEELIPGRDGVVRAARLGVGKSYMEQPVQHLYSLEMSCD